MPRDTLIIHECSQVEELAIPHTVPLHPVRSKQQEPKEEEGAKVKDKGEQNGHHMPLPF